MNDSVYFGATSLLAALIGFSLSQAIGFQALEENYVPFFGALLGAAVTVLGAFTVAVYQSSESRKVELEHERRRQLGARAVLASDLSRLMEYTKKSAVAAVRGAELLRASTPRESLKCPALGEDVLIRLQSLVELLDGEDADQVVDLMHCHQVQFARLYDVINNLNNPISPSGATTVLTKQNFEFTIQSTVEMYLRSEIMFSFARRERESISTPPFSEQRVARAIDQLGVDDWLPDYEKESLVSLMTNLSPKGRWR